MKKENKKPVKEPLSRKRADEIIINRQAVKTSHLTETDVLRLLHTLEMHEIELERQNDELKRSKDNAEIAMNKYTTLYNFAPSGYYTLFSDGTISEVNYVGASMLGSDRTVLEYKNFQQFVGHKYRYLFKDFLKKVFKTYTRELCEIGLTIQGRNSIFAHIEGLALKGEDKCLLAVIDITEQHKAEEAAQENEKKYRYLVQNLPGTTIFLFDKDFRYTLVEGYLHPDLNLSKEMIIGKTLWEILPKENAEKLAPAYYNALKGIPTGNFISNYHGFIYSADILPLKNSKGEITGGMIVSTDITEKRLTESALLHSEEKFRKAFASHPGIAGISTINDGRYLDINDNFCKILGWSREEVIGHTSKELDIFYDYTQRQNIISTLRDKGSISGIEILLKTRTGQIKTGLLSAENITFDDVPCIMIQIIDITELKQAEEALTDSEKKYRMMVDLLPDAIIIHSEGKIVFINPATLAMMGATSADQMLGRSAIDFVHPDYRHLALARIKKINGSQEPSNFTHEKFIKLNNEVIDVEVIGTPVHYRGKPAIQTIIRNITEKKKAEEEIIKLNRIYSVISQINQMIVQTEDRDEIFQKSCEIAVDYGHFKLAWIGLADDRTNDVHAIFWKGINRGYLSKIKKITVSDEPAGNGPTGRVFREGKHVICNDIENDPAMNPWRKEARARGYASSVALPLFLHGKVVAAFSLYAEVPCFFDEKEIVLLDEIAADISYALETIDFKNKNKRIEKELIESEMKFRNLFENSTVGFSMTGLDGSLYVNKSFYNMLGFSKQELSSKKFIEITHPEDVQNSKDAMQSLSEGKESVAHFEKRYIHKDGHIVWAELSIYLQKNNNGEPQYFITSVVDITERKKSEEALQKKMNEMEHFHKLTIGRELSMIELKKEVNKLLKEKGRKEKYPIRE